jgi:hypothetical protein
MSDLVDTPDAWLLQVTGLTVRQCRIDYAFTLVLEAEGGGSFEIRIEQPFAVTSQGTEHELDPEANPIDLAPALSLLHQDVTRVVAFKDGRLELTFDNDELLRVPASEDYEPWNVVGPEGLRIVSLPGGELGIWGAERADKSDV